MSYLEELRKKKQLEARSAASSLTKESLAKAAGVSLPTYRRYEKDPTLMSYASASGIAEVLGCDVSDIFLPKKGN